ncbi:MAG: PKD domain-containing protein [Deltaproteobacteria bacterium]|nr:MAG: PKD domain-containing protein [Deltaproteobacteria bacterium]
MPVARTLSTLLVLGTLVVAALAATDAHAQSRVLLYDSSATRFEVGIAGSLVDTVEVRNTSTTAAFANAFQQDGPWDMLVVDFSAQSALPAALDPVLTAHLDEGGQVMLLVDNLRQGTPALYSDVLQLPQACFTARPAITDPVPLVEDPDAQPNVFRGRFDVDEPIPMRTSAGSITWCSDPSLRNDILLYDDIVDDEGDPVPAIYSVRDGQIIVHSFSSNRYRATDTAAPPGPIEFLLANQLSFLLAQQWTVVSDGDLEALDRFGIPLGIQFNAFSSFDAARESLEPGTTAGLLIDLEDPSSPEGDLLLLLEEAAEAGIPVLLFSPGLGESGAGLLAALDIDGVTLPTSASLLHRGPGGIERVVFRQPESIPDLPLDTPAGFTSFTAFSGYFPLARIDATDGPVTLLGAEDGSLVLGGFSFGGLLTALERDGDGNGDGNGASIADLATFLENLLFFIDSAAPLAYIVTDTFGATVDSELLEVARRAGFFPLVEDDADELVAALGSGSLSLLMIESVLGSLDVLDDAAVLAAMDGWIASGGPVLFAGNDLGERAGLAGVLGVAPVPGAQPLDAPAAIEATLSFAGFFDGLAPVLQRASGAQLPGEEPVYGIPLEATIPGASIARFAGRDEGAAVLWTHDGRVAVNGFVPTTVGQGAVTEGPRAITRFFLNQLERIEEPNRALGLAASTTDADLLRAAYLATGLLAEIVSDPQDLLDIMEEPEGFIHLTVQQPAASAGAGWSPELVAALAQWRETRRGLLLFDGAFHEVDDETLEALGLPGATASVAGQVVRPRSGAGATSAPFLFDDPYVVGSPIAFDAGDTTISVFAGGLPGLIRAARDTGASVTVQLPEATTLISGFLPSMLALQADGDGIRPDREGLLANQITWAGKAPTPVYSGPTEMDEGTSIVLDGSLSRDPFDEALTFAWDLDGDGVYAPGGPTVTLDGSDFNGPDVIELGLEVTNETGIATSTRFTITVNNVAPRVSISGPAGNRILQGATFDPTITVQDVPGDLEIMRVTVDLGDGTEVEAEQHATIPTRFRLPAPHEYDELGTYVITVTAEDGAGATGEATLTIEKVNAPPTTPTPVTADPALPVDEGTSVTFSTTSTDPGDDPIVFLWEPGDGSEPVETETGELTWTYRTSGTFTLRVRARDDAGAQSSQRALQVRILNVAPTITSTPPLTVTEDAPYTYQVTFDDPGEDDVHSFTLEEAPAGMSVSDTGLITWSWDPVTSNYLPVEVTVRVSDNGGGSDSQSWTIEPVIEDGDGGGAPDSCEIAYGLDPEDPSDDVEDLSGDGLTVADACIIGRDPTAFTGPEAPVLIRPTDDSAVRNLPLDVRLRVVEPRDDVPFSAPLTYTVQVFDSEDLEEPMFEVTDLDEAGPAFVDVVFSDFEPEAGTRYWWRARAEDPWAVGEWSSVWSFVYSPENTPPGAPGIVSPSGFATENPPVLRVRNAVDPDGDRLLYEFEVFRGTQPTASERVFRITDVAEGDGGETSVELTDPLQEGQTYLWRARARDGLQAGPFALSSFEVNTTNRAPSAPVLVAPSEDELLIGTDTQTFTWENSVDPDGDTLTYRLEFSRTSDFEEVILDVDRILQGRQSTTSVTRTLPFQTSGVIHWRVRAFDGLAYSDPTASSFRFVSFNTAPSAPVAVAPIGGQRVISPSGEAELTVSNATDPEGQPLTYQFQVSRSPDWTRLVASVIDVAEQPDQTSVRVEDLQDETYFWRARANDGIDFGPWSQTASFELRFRDPGAVESDRPPLTDGEDDEEPPSGGGGGGCSASAASGGPWHGPASLALLLLGFLAARRQGRGATASATRS